MSRLIKFRAWNTETSKMVDLYKITPLALSMEQDGLFLPFDDKYPLMQFTGHQTIDKQDVYEGDILQFYSEKEQIEGYYTVEWLEETGQWGLMFGQAPHRIQMGTIGMARFMQVAGNIYENKELIDG